MDKDYDYEKSYIERVRAMDRSGYHQKLWAMDNAIRTHRARKKKKKVHFNDAIVVYEIETIELEPNVDWMICSLDRYRFQKRIADTGVLLDQILTNHALIAYL